MSNSKNFKPGDLVRIFSNHIKYNAPYSYKPYSDSECKLTLQFTLDNELGIWLNSKRYYTKLLVPSRSMILFVDSYFHRIEKVVE